MNEWMAILQVQEQLACDLSVQLAIAVTRSWFSPATAKRVLKTIKGQRDIALDIRAQASAIGNREAAKAAEAVIQQWNNAVGIVGSNRDFENALCGPKKPDRDIY